MLMSLSNAFRLHTDVSNEDIDIYTSETDGNVRLTIEADTRCVEDTQSITLILSKNQANAMRGLLHDALMFAKTTNECLDIQ